MAVDEPAVRLRLRRKLEELVGVEETDLLMDRPPGGWSALVTNETLDLKLGALESRVDSRFDALEGRMNARFEGIDSRFGGIDCRFETLEAQMTTGFEGVHSRFAALEDRIDSRINKAFVTQTWRLGGFMLGLGALIVAALRV